MSALATLGSLGDLTFGGPGSNLGAGPAVSGTASGSTTVGGLTIHRDAGVSLPGGGQISGSLLMLGAIVIGGAILLRRR